MIYKLHGRACAEIKLIVLMRMCEGTQHVIHHDSITCGYTHIYIHPHGLNEYTGYCCSVGVNNHTGVRYCVDYKHCQNIKELHHCESSLMTHYYCNVLGHGAY